MIADLQIIAGQLSDLAEVCKDNNAAEKIKQIEKKLEKLIADDTITEHGGTSNQPYETGNNRQYIFGGAFDCFSSIRWVGEEAN